MRFGTRFVSSIAELMRRMNIRRCRASERMIAMLRILMIAAVMTLATSSLASADTTPDNFNNVTPTPQFAMIPAPAAAHLGIAGLILAAIAQRKIVRRS